MALVISMKEGDDVFVGAACVQLTRILAPNRFRMTSADREFEVGEEVAVEVLPNVFVSAGHNAHRDMARVAIEAPQDQLILRGDAYRRGQGVS